MTTQRNSAESAATKMNKKTIRNILVTAKAPASNHIMNGGEKAYGNASTIKRTPAGNAYSSGQQVRYSLATAMSRINDASEHKGATYLSNGDGVTPDINTDIRADLFGYMLPKQGVYSGRRDSPISATFAVAMEPSAIGRDLLTRIKVTAAEGESDERHDQVIATKEYSNHDIFLINFSLNVSEVGLRTNPTYDKNLHVNNNYEYSYAVEERFRRIALFLEATNALVDFANQARNAVTLEPQQVLIVLDNEVKRKAMRYWVSGETERKNILAELDDRGAFYILGDDTEGEVSVAEAYKRAANALLNSKLYTMGGDPVEIIPEKK